MYTISLLGCGKLGFPIALELISQGYNIKGSTTTPSKINQLKQSGIIPYLIKIDEFVALDFFESDILLITLPFKKTFLDPNIYNHQIQLVYNKVKSSKIRHIVFISSSSVYPKDNQMYSPIDNIKPTNLRAKVLLECEDILKSLSNISTIIIRLGGIYGAKRKIKKSNKARRLIEQSDAIRLIIDNIKKVDENGSINGFELKLI